MLTSKQSSNPIGTQDLYYILLQPLFKGKAQLPFTYHAAHQLLPQCKDEYLHPYDSLGHYGYSAYKSETHYQQPYRQSITQSKKSLAPRIHRLVHTVSGGVTKPSRSIITSPKSTARAQPWSRQPERWVEELLALLDQYTTSETASSNRPEDGKDTPPSSDDGDTCQLPSDEGCDVKPVYSNGNAPQTSSSDDSDSESAHTLSNDGKSSQSDSDDSAYESAHDDCAYVNKNGGLRFGYDEAPIPTKFRGRTHYLNFFSHTNFENRDALAGTRAHDYLLTCVGFNKDWYSDNKQLEALYRMHHIHSLLAGRKDLNEKVETMKENRKFVNRERVIARRRVGKARRAVCLRV